MHSLHLLVVDDDPIVIQTLRTRVESPWRVIAAQSHKELPSVRLHAAFVDLHLSGRTDRAEGLELIQTLRHQDPHIEIIAMSGDLDRELMEKCLKAGASRYLAKPLNIDEVRLTLEKIESWLLLQQATARPFIGAAQWVGDSKHSQLIRKKVAELRGEQGPLLIEGESGTGKEVVAQMLHAQEPERPFVCVNMGGIPDNLFESEFFGHVRGAFTGADQNKMGLAEAAHGGDLFLDEIEALPVHHQAKLLRFLESGEVRRVGSRQSIQVNTRVLVATNQNLEQLAQKKLFREDLLYRLNGRKIMLPALRDRLDDIPALTEYFLSQDPRRTKSLSLDAVDTFKQYPWSGNVRELKRICEQLLIVAPLPIIRSEDVARLLHPQIRYSETQDIRLELGLTPLMEKHESFLIQKCLDQVGDVDEAARVLKISRSNLYKKIKDLSIAWKGQA